MIQDIFSIRGSQFGNFSFFFARPKSFRKKPARRREIFTWDAYHAYHGNSPVEFFFLFSDIKTMLFYSGKRNKPAKDNCSAELFRRPLFIASSFSVDFTLPEIGDILRPRSIWHAVSNYQDGGIKKAVHRKNKD